MILQRIVHDGSISFEGDGYRLVNLHAMTADCLEHHCLVHWPDWDATPNVEGWPYNWREDRSMMERICPHGIGHPDPDGANYWNRMGRAYMNVHGCDGCCGR